MSETSDSFIEDLHNAWMWTTYCDTVVKAVWAFLVFKRFNFHLANILSIYEKYL
jgi:hypothetical protein